MVSFNKTSSKTTSGYSDPNTQAQRDWWSKKTMGSGGLYDQYAKGSDIYSGDSSYQGEDFTSSPFDPTDFGSSSYNATTYNPYEFSAPSLSYTELDDKQFQNKADVINKNMGQAASRIIQKQQDDAAYQGRGGGDLADYRASQTLRDTASAQADALKGLASDKLGLEFADKQNVNKFLAEADMWKQGAQAGENMAAKKASDESAMTAEQLAMERKRASEASKQFGAQDTLARKTASESSKQFGEKTKMEYLSGKLQELMGGKQSLNDLMQLIQGFSEAGQLKPTSSSKGGGFGIGG